MTYTGKGGEGPSLSGARGIAVTRPGLRPVPINILDDEYITVAEVARRLSVSHKTVRRRMVDGTWEKGVVWFQPPGTHPRLSWKAVVAWQRGEG